MWRAEDETTGLSRACEHVAEQRRRVARLARIEPDAEQLRAVVTQRALEHAHGLAGRRGRRGPGAARVAVAQEAHDERGVDRRVELGGRVGARAVQAVHDRGQRQLLALDRVRLRVEEDLRARDARGLAWGCKGSDNENDGATHRHLQEDQHHCGPRIHVMYPWEWIVSTGRGFHEVRPPEVVEVPLGLEHVAPRVVQVQERLQARELTALGALRGAPCLIALALALALGVAFERAGEAVALGDREHELRLERTFCAKQKAERARGRRVCGSARKAEGGQDTQAIAAFPYLRYGCAALPWEVSGRTARAWRRPS